MTVSRTIDHLIVSEVENKRECTEGRQADESKIC